MVVEFIDAHRDRFGVAPICRVLTEHGVPIAPSTYRAFRTRPASARSTSDAALLVQIVRVHAETGRGLYGARKVWRQLRRDRITVGRCRVERLMRAHGLRGVVRGRTWRTTRADPTAARPTDLVGREFTATRPNQLWVVDFT